MRVLVTGANGFIGARVCARLTERGYAVRALVRAAKRAHGLVAGEIVIAPSIDNNPTWLDQVPLEQIDAIIHLAARVHVMRDRERDPLEAFRAVNVIGTRDLAQRASACGVKRFVYVSSIKVNGEGTPLDQPYRADDVPNPQDDYGISKYEAEIALHEIERASGMEVTIVRPPLVYGAGVKGNFASLLRWVERGVPLPLGAARNQRSLVTVDNLADALVRCVDHPAAAGQTFLISDGEHISTPELLRRIGVALHQPVRLIHFPEKLLRLLMQPLGRAGTVDRLFGSLVVDDAHLRNALDWQPTDTMETALRATAAWWKARSS